MESSSVAHDHSWSLIKEDGVTAVSQCGCGAVMSVGPGKVETEDEYFRCRVIEVVIADLKANGKIRMAMIGL